MNKSLIANANVRIWILDCRGRKIKRKNNTRCNSTKGEQVQEVVMWHWHILMSEKMTDSCYISKILDFEKSHSPSNCTPVDTGRKLNVRKTLRRRPGRLLNVLCAFNLRPVSTGTELTSINNEDIVYTLLNIFKYRCNTKETNKKRIK